MPRISPLNASNDNVLDRTTLDSQFIQEMHMPSSGSNTQHTEEVERPKPTQKELARMEAHYRMGYYYWYSEKHGAWTAFWRLVIRPSMGDIITSTFN